MLAILLLFTRNNVSLHSARILSLTHKFLLRCRIHGPKFIRVCGGNQWISWVRSVALRHTLRNRPEAERACYGEPDFDSNFFGLGFLCWCCRAACFGGGALSWRCSVQGLDCLRSNLQSKISRAHDEQTNQRVFVPTHVVAGFVLLHFYPLHFGWRKHFSWRINILVMFGSHHFQAVELYLLLPFSAHACRKPSKAALYVLLDARGLVPALQANLGNTKKVKKQGFLKA